MHFLLQEVLRVSTGKVGEGQSVTAGLVRDNRVGVYHLGLLEAILYFV